MGLETIIKNNDVIVAGEVTSIYTPNYEQEVRNILSTIGYDDANTGFDHKTATV